MGLVQDLFVGVGGASPQQLTNVNGTLYFTATTAETGLELWKTNGSAASTTLVKDIRPIGSANPTELTNVNGTLYFSAANEAENYELWKSDGTAAGTVLVKEIFGGPGGSTPLFLTNVNGTLYFYASDGISGQELWKSDGTAAGTTLVKDIRPGIRDSQIFPPYMTNVNGTLYFVATDGLTADELWKSDGTAAGTVLVKDIRLGATSSNPRNFVNVNNTLYFVADTASNARELWRSDGTTAGTFEVKDIGIGYSSSPLNLTNVNGTLFFTAFDLEHGQELWKSDGTAAGTVLVKDIQVGSDDFSPVNLTNVNGTLYFSGNNSSGNSRTLWKSDGTAAGTVQVAAIGSANNKLANLTNANGTLYFTSFDDATGEELWKSNGTAAGTVLVEDILPGSFGAMPTKLTAVGNQLYFSAQNAPNGRELWVVDQPLTARSEIFWRNPNGLEVFWYQDNAKLVSAGLINSPYDTPAWRLKGTADMDGDGFKDQIYQNVTTRQLGYLPLLKTNGLTTGAKAAVTPTFNSFFGAAAGQVATPGAGWELIGIENIAGTAQADLIFYSRTLDRLVYWETNATGQFVGAGVFTSSLNPAGQGTGAANSWNVEALADFTGEGNVDILWRNTQGVTVLWKINGSVIDLAASKVLPTVTSNFQLRGIGDFNGDGIQDIAWRDQAANVTRFWTFNGTGIPAETTDNSAIVAAGFQIEAIADFDGDGKSDLVWRDTISDRSVIWNFDLSGTLAGPTFQAGSIRPGSDFIRNFLPGVTNNAPYVNGDRNWDIDAANGL